MLFKIKHQDYEKHSEAFQHLSNCVQSSWNIVNAVLRGSKWLSEDTFLPMPLTQLIS